MSLARPVAWATVSAGGGAAAAGLYGMFGWPAAVLFVGGCLMVFGVLVAAVAGAAGGGRR